ncbi:MAG: C25 family cysteine peptidase [Bacteroidales bacterium]|nr:C25 family cysteine peptidase [Bacteroidales bacterium]
MKRYLYLFFAICMLSMHAFAQQKKFFFTQGEINNIEVNSISDYSFEATFRLANFELSSVTVNQRSFTLLSADGFTLSYDVGKPMLPTFNKLIEIPGNASFYIEIVEHQFQEFNLNDSGFTGKLFPSQPSWCKCTSPDERIFAYDSLFYQKDEWFSYPLIHVEDEGFVRGVNIGTLIISPFQYNPKRNSLRITTSIQFIVHFEISSTELQQYSERKNNLYSPAWKGYFKELINYDDKSMNKDVISKYPIKFVIVADRMFQSALQPFIQWKKEKGFTVIEAYTDMPSVGNTATSIKNYLQNLYNAGNSNDPAPTYVLLVGDVEQIPNFSSQSSGTHVTDLYFACYDGSSDYLPDVYYGRFSAQNVNQLIPQIEKTLMYEKYTLPSKNYLDTVVMVAGVDATYSQVYANGQINYGTTYYFEPGHGIYSHTYLYPTSNQPWVDADMVNKIGKGVGFANYTAHCSSSGWADPVFSSSQVASLPQNYKFGLLVGNCCQSNKFEENSCFGETLLRAQGKGAVGYIGASDYSYWDEDYFWAVGYTTNIVEYPTYNGTGLGAYDRTFHDHGEPYNEWFVTNGQMIMAGNLAVQASNSTRKKYYWEIYHLMGDPSVMTYYSKPESLYVSYATPIMIDQSQLTVQTEPYTLVAISQNGILLDSKYSLHQNTVTLTFSPLSTNDSVLIVATKQNKIPYIKKEPVQEILFNLDAKLHSIIEPHSYYPCFNQAITPKVVIQNKGISTLNQLTISYTIDGVPYQNYVWTGSLQSQQKDTVFLSPFTLQQNSHEVCFYVSSPNNGTDQNLSNDTICVEYFAENATIVADFTYNPNSICYSPATIQFTNQSLHAFEYVWDFGDGQISHDPNPTHIYQLPGDYNVTLTASASVCGQDQKTLEIIIGASNPIVNDTAHCGPTSFVLTANGSNLIWYDSTLTNILAEGDTFVTPLLTTSTTYYVLNQNIYNYTGGKPDNSGPGGYYTSTNEHCLIFNCYEPVTLKTVKVYAGSSGNRTIKLKDSQGNTLTSTTVNIPSGEQIITLNMNIPVGNNLQLCGPAAPNLYRNGSTTGPDLPYPYQIDSVISIIRSTASNYELKYYYYFYNWNVEKICSSNFVPIHVNIDYSPEPSFTYEVHGDTVIFTNTSIGNGQYTWHFGDGTSSNEISPVHVYSSYGVYTVTLIQQNSCGIDSISMDVIIYSGISNFNPNIPCIIYPNPVSDQLHIYFQNSINGLILIRDLTGKIIYLSTIEQKHMTIPVNSWNEGLYLIHVQSENSAIIPFTKISQR